MPALIQRRPSRNWLHLNGPARRRLGDRALESSPAQPGFAAHSLHLHPLSFISGTYYVTTPKGCPGLKFEDPRLDRFMAAPPKRPGARRENQTHVTYPAVAGNVLLFESWLRHEVAPNPTEAERISISFNYSWF